MIRENTGSARHKKVRKGFLFLSAVILTSLTLSIEYPLLMLESTLPGNSDISSWGLAQYIFHWLLTCTVWGLSFTGIRLLLKAWDFDLFEIRRIPSIPRLICMLCVILAGILYMSSTWEFQFKPMVEWQNMMSRFGQDGGWGFFFQYLYYLIECMLITLIITSGQEAGECFFATKASGLIPWGGIFCALSWGLLHALSKDWNTALLCIFLSLLFGAAYLLAYKNIRYAYMAIALIFLL